MLFCYPMCVLCCAVRGAIAIKSAKYTQDLADGKGDGLPFNKVYQCNIGNPQILGQVCQACCCAAAACCCCLLA